MAGHHVIGGSPLSFPTLKPGGTTDYGRVECEAIESRGEAYKLRVGLQPMFSKRGVRSSPIQIYGCIMILKMVQQGSKERVFEFLV